MGYRDDREAAAARTEQLEDDLAKANAEIARLKGHQIGGANAFLGGPTRIEVERTFEGELPESEQEEMIEVLRARFGQLGRTERLGATLSWQIEAARNGGGGRNVAVRITTRDGRTRIRIEERIGQLAGGLFGGIVGGAGGAGSINLLVWFFITGNVLLGLGGVAWFALVYGIVRTAFSAVARSRSRALDALADELADAASDSVAVVRARVTDDQEEAEVEAEAPSESKKRRA